MKWFGSGNATEFQKVSCGIHVVLQRMWSGSPRSRFFPTFAESPNLLHEIEGLGQVHLSGRNSPQAHRLATLFFRRLRCCMEHVRHTAWDAREFCSPLFPLFFCSLLLGLPAAAPRQRAGRSCAAGGRLARPPQDENCGKALGEHQPLLRSWYFQNPSRTLLWGEFLGIPGPSWQSQRSRISGPNRLENVKVGGSGARLPGCLHRFVIHRRPLPTPIFKKENFEGILQHSRILSAKSALATVRKTSLGAEKSRLSLHRADPQA